MLSPKQVAQGRKGWEHHGNTADGAFKKNNSQDAVETDCLIWGGDKQNTFFYANVAAAAVTDAANAPNTVDP